MNARLRSLLARLALSCLPFLLFPRTAAAEDDGRAVAAMSRKVYGEWRIQVRPDQGQQYQRLIEQEGLPLFREAGGRMVGWWTTLVGDLYEQLTIWEYDDMAAFERAVGFLGQSEEFARFVAQRDPLLKGERNRFLQLAAGGQPPELPDNARYVIHERHRVALAKREEYLKIFTGPGLAMLKKHGFRPVGPLMVEIGDWMEMTWLFRFESLAERRRLIGKFGEHADAAKYGERLAELVDEVATQVCLPAPFTAERLDVPAEARSLLPHVEQVASGVFAAGLADKYQSANCGWTAVGDEAWLIDLPRGVPADRLLKVVQQTTGRPARRLVLTTWQTGDENMIRSLIDGGIHGVVTSPAIGHRLTAAGVAAEALETPDQQTPLGGEATSALFFPLDGIAAAEGAAVYLADRRVLFAGPAVVYGPRVRLAGCDTDAWLSTLGRLDGLGAKSVVPGFGTWGGAERLRRQRRFLTELRRSVGYVVAQGRPLATLTSGAAISAADLAWMPYDTPTDDDLAQVYRELTVPIAPFHGSPPAADDGRPRALVLIGDQPHEPDHLEEGLRPAFEATGVVPYFTVDVRALTAENLARVPLLVILRDGLQRPTLDHADDYQWMTPEQERAVVEFVERGGAFLNLHNSMGLYPDDGPYLNLVGGRYTGHGPLERFRVEVVDHDHPITHGVTDFSVADEQHAPTYDADRVHLLLKNRSDNGHSAAAGWVREPGRGRLCHLANGHTRESLLHPMYQRLLRNAIDWCLRR
jgi:type 1 glutamine amidotransferase